MEKSYAKLMTKRVAEDEEKKSVAAAVDSLRRHSCRNVICSRCENDDESRFQVTDVDKVTGSVVEVKCKRCKQMSHVCCRQCYVQRSPIPDSFEYSYKEKLLTVQHVRKWIHICIVMESTIALLRRKNDGDGVCSCGSNDQELLKVLDIDRLGFITSLQCPGCQQQLALSPFEESYIVQMLFQGYSDQESVVQKVLDGDHVEHIREVCNLLQLHSFYEESVCPEFDIKDEDCCRVTAINKADGNVTEVEFDVTDEKSHKVQRLQITCRSTCYYLQYNSPSQYELTYKEKMRKHLEAVAGKNRRIESSNEAILSCTVLAANATILRRHNIENKLCPNCNNDDHDFLKVIDIDKHGFITRVQCTKCKQFISTACHHSRFYYEKIDETMRLERGDHISWHRNLAYWHHGIVTHADDRTVTFAHYGANKCSVIFHESTANRQEMSSVCDGTPHRISYDDCYTNEYAALRAEILLGEKRYNILNRNCEHTSHGCKTGLVKSDQLMTCFSSVGKTLLAFFLRILNMLLLVVFQIVHEKREKVQIDRKAFERFEHIVTGAYMLLVFLLFSVWSLYSECNKLKPTTANNNCCRRPSDVACGLSIRIIVREIFAAAGPFLLIWFEDRILLQGVLWSRQVTLFFTLLGVTVVSYVLGAVVGALLEYIGKRHFFCCCIQREQINDHLEEEIQYVENPETTELPSTSMQMESFQRF